MGGFPDCVELLSTSWEHWVLVPYVYIGRAIRIDDGGQVLK